MTALAPTGNADTSVTPTARERWSRSRIAVVIGILVVLVGILLGWAQSQYGQGHLDPTSVQPSGSRALAEILGDAGVTVEDTETDADLLDRAGPGSTVLVTEPDLLDADRFTSLAGTGADLVLVEANAALEHLRTDIVAEPIGGGEVVDPECDLPAAAAAGEARVGGLGYSGSELDQRCYPVDDTAGLAVHSTDDGTTITLLGSGDVLTNRYLDEDGNAALAMNLLGGHPHLIWFRPQVTGSGDTAATDLLPAWVGPVVVMLAVTAAVAAVWRGRRMGRLVIEPLPVVVRASETAEGRGRLYRHGQDRAHSAEVLRQATIDRLRSRLSMSRAVPNDEVIAAVADRLGRTTDDVAGILGGDPPTDDAALIALADDLDGIEARLRATR